MKNLKGYSGKILRIDLTEGTHKTLPLGREDAIMFLGGRGFNSMRLYKEIGSQTNPLGPENKLMFSVGPLVGTMFPTASRFNVSAKSPQTGILGDSNAGGHVAPEIKFAGYDQIILEGMSRKLIYIIVNDDEIKLMDGYHLRGLDVYETDRILRSELGDSKIQTIIAGPAAENGVLFGGLFANLMRAAARTGMGTVMASKNVKAIAVRGTGLVEVADAKRFEEIVLEIEEQIREHDQYWPRRKMGTTRILKMANEAGFLPTRHYTSGIFEYADNVSGERLAREFNVKSRGCFACTIPCSRFYIVKNGVHSGLYGEGPEYESQGCFTSRLGNSELETALKANDMCNKLGLDTITTAEVIGWAMELYERGMLKREETDDLELTWGNTETILTLIEKIAHREGFGDILADGSVPAAEKLGIGKELTMQVKGLDLIMADPRGLKGFGLGYAVASRGGDHLRSEPFIELTNDPSVGEEMFGIPEAAMGLANKGKGKLVSYFEDWNAVIDSLEACKNIMQNMMILTFQRASQVIEATIGIYMTPSQVRDIGARIVNIERAIGVREGIRRADDSLPRRFREEPLREGASAGSVFDQKPILDEYYKERGWDSKTGIPKEMTLEKLKIAYVSNDTAYPTH